MFSPLAKGNGSWNGYLEDKSIYYDNLFPSIYQASTPSDVKIPSPDTFGVSKTQDCALQLPKTYLTRKGAIVLFASQNGKQLKHNEREKHNRNNENENDESLLQDLPTFKSSCLSQSSPKPEDQIQEQMSPKGKRKLFLEFLDVFLKDPTNKQEISPATTDKPKSKEDYEEDQTENVLKVLSRPQSITSFYNNCHHYEVKPQKTRPKTGNIIPREPEQLKAHPRITSAKPRPPTRALGKIPSKNHRSEFDKEKTSFIPPPTFVTRQVKTPNCSTTNEMVQEDRVSIPRPNSECHFERYERASRAASSISRYSAWWATDDASLGYYDNELQDADDEYPECIECLSEQRSEIGRMPTSDIETEEGNENQRTSQNWASKRNSQQERAKLNASSSVNSTASFNDVDSQTLGDVLYDASFPGQTNKSRVKSAPCLVKRKLSKYSRTYPRKAFSAGPSRPHSQHERVAPTPQEENYFVRIPSTASCHGNDDVETISISKDLSEKPTFTERGNNSEMSRESCDIILTNQEISTTSFPGISFVSRGGEGSGYTMGRNSTKDGTGVDTLHNSVKTHRDDHQDNCLESNVVELQESTRKTDFQAYKNLDNEIHPDQMLSEVTSSDITERQDTELGKGRQRESDVSSAVFSSERNCDDRENEELDVTTQAEQESLVKETEFEEEYSVGSDDGDGVAQDEGLTNLLHDLPSGPVSKSDDKPIKTEDLSEKNLQRAVLHETITESPHEAGFEIKELPETNPDDLTEATEPGHFDIDEVQDSSETDLNTDDSDDVRENQLETDLKTDEISEQETTETHYSGNAQSLSGKVQSSSGNVQSSSGNVQSSSGNVQSSSGNVQSSSGKVQSSSGNVQSSSGNVQSSSGNVQSSSGNVQSSSGKVQSSSGNVQSSSGNVQSSSSDEDTNIAASTNSVFIEHKSTDVQQDVAISVPKVDRDLRTKSTPDEDTTTAEKGRSKKIKTDKPKREKLDVQGVGKADNKMKETKENMEMKKVDKITETKEKQETKVQNKVDLSELVAKKGSNKTIKKPTLGKKTRSPKTRRKPIVTSEYTPEPESSLDVIPAVDENLLNMIDNLDGDLELSEETLNQFAPVEDFQEPGVLSVLEDSSVQTTDAFSPSKVKKGGKKTGSSNKKKGKVVESDVSVSEERKKMAEEKAKQEEEMKSLQEREEQQMRLMEEAKEKQRTIEEERDKRLAQEAEARKQQEAAEQTLKEAKKKAKEEREKRREVEAERRKMEVQRKREEKRKRELEIQKREELAKQREDRELKMAELQAEKERELELERIAEEQRKEEERLRLLEQEEEKRKEEEKIREAEEAVQRMAREREYREQMRKIAEAQQAKLEKQEVDRRAKEEQERVAIEEERARLEHEAQLRENEEQERVRELRQKEAIARIRAAHEASKRRAWALRRRAQNTERMSNLRFTRHAQKLTEAFTFSYHVQVPREVWELPYDWNSKKKRGNRPLRKKQNGGKKP